MRLYTVQAAGKTNSNRFLNPRPMLPADGLLPDEMNGTGPHEALLELRARAEQRRSLLTAATQHHSPEEVQRLVHELQVHQIELEMQYDELLRAQAEAEAVRAEYVDMYDWAPVGYLTLTAVGLISQLNLCASQQLGTARARLLQRRFALFVAPADRPAFGQFLARTLRQDRPQSCELQLLRPDGTAFPAQLEARRSGLPGPAQCRLAVLDTSAHHQAMTALAASEARFRKLFADSADAVVLLQGERVVDCNQATLRLLGAREREEVVDRSVLVHCPDVQPDGRPTAELFHETTAAARRAGSARREALMRKATGEEIWVESVITVIEADGPAPLVHMLWRDVTVARAAQEELRLSEERLQMALAASGSGVWVWEVASHRLHWDAPAQAIFGLPHHPEPVSFDVLRRAVHPDDLPAVTAALQQALGSRVPLDLEHRICWPDGRVRYVAALGKALYDEQGEPLGLIGIMRDTTPRREAENALRREKEFTESLLDNSIDGVLALDRAGRVTAWNAELGRYFGLEAAAVLGRPVFEVLPSMDKKTRQAVAQAQAGAATSCLNRPFRVRPGHFDAYLVPLPDNGAPEPSGVLVIIRDVTERNRLAEEATQLRLRQQQEVLAAILTTQETERKRIAEALHNGLGQLLYAAKLSLDGPGKRSAPAQHAIHLLDDAIRSTRTISFELTPGILEDFGLRTALETLVKRMAPAQLPVRLHLRHLEERLAPTVEIAVYRTVQELLNNVMKHAQATEAVVHVAREHGRLDVSVEDNGRGFDPAALHAQPLAGIGLSGVRNRVALLGGELSIKSWPGRGSIVSFELTL